MASRVEGARSRDNFPTPPWATRALIEIVFPKLFGVSGVAGYGYGPLVESRSAWEPACGQGIMADVLREYFRFVQASDLYAYGHSHSGWNFLTMERPEQYDWIITNPPFGAKTIPFILRAIKLARVGVAMFLRLQVLETVGRYEKIFKPHPPTVIAPFVERVNLCKGIWNPDGGTATAYCWIVWMKGRKPLPMFWIPPGRKVALTHADDRARFAAWSLPRKAA